ncbi:hypothetical protein AU210_016766 [Fusarium oxysporum f. sp. radicis-cucumerinum]|uniref:Uncharacterized protein n=1 Tax=Fusarium oxysporum f. sp. radicis-cucumerinum TaxID=327505 RepID=A0A2H3FNN0_FUSOX|nr:hypothetical protein AU210_016766 [Fusarium oxysporum f. sp. radicis-cucumerinum]
MYSHAPMEQDADFPTYFQKSRRAKHLIVNTTHQKRQLMGLKEVNYRIVNMAKLSKIADFLLLFLSGHGRDSCHSSS